MNVCEDSDDGDVAHGMDIEESTKGQLSDRCSIHPSLNL